MGVTLAPGINHRPGSSSENIIQPVVDATGLILRPFSNGQTSPVFQVQNVDGTAVHFGLNPDGEIELSGGVGTNGQVLTSAGAGNPVAWSTPATPDLSTAPLLAPNSVNRNLIQPTADGGKGLVIQAHSDTQSAPLLECIGGAADNLTTAPYLAIHASPSTENLFTVQDVAVSGGSEGLVVVKADSSCLAFGVFGDATNSADTMHVSDRNGSIILATCQVNGAALSWSLLSANGVNGAPAGLILPALADNSLAGFKGRLSLCCPDHANSFPGREVLRGESSGAAPMIGFLGAAAVVRQTGGAATAGVLYTAAEQAMLQKVYDMGRTFGLLT